MRASWAYILFGASLAFCAAADEALSSDFLEFLGNGSQVGDQWFDPMCLHESPEAFATVITTREDMTQHDDPAHQPDSTSSTETPTTTSRDDGGKDND